MEPPTPSAALYKGRDKEQIDSIKKLILSETDKQKFKRRGRGGGPGSDSDEDAEGDGEKRGKGAAEGAEGVEGAGGGPAKKAKPKGVWRKGKFIPYEETEEGRYRDRAKERRTGINPDYDGEIEKMVEVDAEKSKYLGGDLKHTHLVKGLDYALLVKIKEEARRKEDEERAARLALKAQAGQLQPGETDFNTDEGGSGRPPTIRTYSGRALYAALQAVNRPKPPDFRRVLYEFDLCEDGTGDVPTVLARSNADVEAEGLDADDDLDNRINYIVDDDFLTRLTHNLTQFRLHGRPGKRKKRQREGAADGDAPAKSAKPRVKALDVVDIFAGIQAKPRPLEPGEIHTIPPPPPPLPPSQPPLPRLPYDDDQPPLPPYDDQHPPPPPPLPKSRGGGGGGGVFEGLRASGGGDDDDVELSAAVQAPSREDMARSIRAAAAAAKRKHGGSGMAPPLPPDESGKIDRDVFGAGAENRGGHSLSAGTYEVGMYPDALGEYGGGAGSDDEEGEVRARSQLGEQMDKKAGGGGKKRRMRPSKKEG